MVGPKIKALRQAKGWSQKELAEKSGVLQPRICELERGITKYASTENMVKLAAALGVTVEELMKPIASGE